MYPVFVKAIEPIGATEVGAVTVTDVMVALLGRYGFQGKDRVSVAVALNDPAFVDVMAAVQGYAQARRLDGSTELSVCRTTSLS